MPKIWPRPKELEEVYQVRAMIEGFTGRLLTKKADLGKISKLRSILESIEERDYEGSVHMLGQLTVEFHQRFIEMSGNTVLIRCYANVIPVIRRYHSIGLNELGLWRPSMKEHNKILTVIESGDAELAGQVCEEHVIKAHARLSNYIVSLSEKCLEEERGGKLQKNKSNLQGILTANAKSVQRRNS